MSDDTNTFTRNPEVVAAPQLRPNNSGLGNVVVDDSVLNLPDRGASTRPSNTGLNNVLANSNQPVGSGQAQANDRAPNMNIEGGGLFHVKNPGWDPRHPRLSRDPNWYPGRGKDRFKKAMKSIGNVVGQVAQTVADNPELVAV
tara:strand:- start:787 stop:1215 length:429 start_codon:yes stop_codon:yes gene_type:complete